MSFADYLKAILPAAFRGSTNAVSIIMTFVMAIIGAVLLRSPETIAALNLAITFGLALVWLLALVGVGSYQLLVERDGDIRKLKAKNSALADKFARVEFIYQEKRPFVLRDANYYRVGVKNYGPSWAESVKVRLEEITPASPLKDFLLPITLTYAHGGAWKHIETGVYRPLDVVKWSFDQANEMFTVELCTEVGQIPFEMRHGEEYRLHLVIAWRNTREARRGEFVIRAHQNRILFTPADGALSRITS